MSSSACLLPFKTYCLPDSRVTHRIRSCTTNTDITKFLRSSCCEYSVAISLVQPMCRSTRNPRRGAPACARVPCHRVERRNNGARALISGPTRSTPRASPPPAGPSKKRKPLHPSSRHPCFPSSILAGFAAVRFTYHCGS